MPRLARITAPGLTYHVTHRGNRRGDVFFSREDRELYLRRLAAGGRDYGLEIWAYCLMTNHVHLLVRGEERDALPRVMRRLQGQYARHVNQERGWQGHLWANRYYSHPIDGHALWASVRYIEQNPVRAGIARHAEEYHWSSARAHCGLDGGGILSPNRPFPGGVSNWRRFLEIQDESGAARIRRACREGKPAGDDEFVSRLEKQLGRTLRRRPKGRPAKSSLGSSSLETR
jgi:putative transposase